MSEENPKGVISEENLEDVISAQNLNDASSPESLNPEFGISGELPDETGVVGAPDATPKKAASGPPPTLGERSLATPQRGPPLPRSAHGAG